MKTSSSQNLPEFPKGPLSKGNPMEDEEKVIIETRRCYLCGDVYQIARYRDGTAEGPKYCGMGHVLETQTGK